MAGARPRTLPISIVPVLAGAAASGHPTAIRTGAALLVALLLQIGANYANDYFDGVRGVDSGRRIGPARLVASGAASRGAVLVAAGLALAVAGVLGLWLAIAAGVPQLIVLGGCALLAAVLYTGGPRPYSGIGVADLAVFAFFGLFATCGTAAVEIGHPPRAAWWASIPIGLLAAAVLMANNLRDIDSDTAAGRRTLTVRLGIARGRALYRAVMICALLVPVGGVALRGLPVEALDVLVATPLVVRPIRLVAQAHGVRLVPALVATVKAHVAVGLLLTAALAANTAWPR